MKKRKDVRAVVAAALIEQLAVGTKPWSKSWSISGTGLPKRHTGDLYHGINRLLLMMLGYSNPYFMTFNQAAILSGMKKDDSGNWVREDGQGVRAGEKSPAHVVYAAPKTVRDYDSDAPDAKKDIFFWRQSSVFNASQIDGLPDRYYPAAIEIDANKTLEHHTAADALVKAMEDEAPIEYQGDSAFYAPSRDTIRCPVPQAFESMDAFYATLLHEGVHRTGHKSRLDRKHDYSEKTGRAREELVAEIGAAMLCCAIGLSDEPREDHASYIHSWIQLLENDNNAIFSAAKQADSAMAYMLDQANQFHGHVIAA